MNNAMYAKPKMNNATRLKICDGWLGRILILILASGIQLEVTSGKYAWSVWVHIVLGIILTVLSCYHIYLHYKTGNWFVRFAKNKNVVTRILWWIFLLTAVTGIIATFAWIGHDGHMPIGGIHGKIGFLMVIFGIIHAVRHIRKRKHSQLQKQLQK